MGDEWELENHVFDGALNLKQPTPAQAKEFKSLDLSISRKEETANNSLTF